MQMTLSCLLIHSFLHKKPGLPDLMLRPSCRANSNQEKMEDEIKWRRNRKSNGIWPVWFETRPCYFVHISLASPIWADCKKFSLDKSQRSEHLLWLVNQDIWPRQMEIQLQYLITNLMNSIKVSLKLENVNTLVFDMCRLKILSAIYWLLSLRGQFQVTFFELITWKMNNKMINKCS